MQEEHMRFEASVYALFDAQVAANHLARSGPTKGTIAHKDYLIKYVTKWKRLSGDWNTSLGNSIVSMAICITAILSLPSHLRPRRVFAMFLGDDYLGVYNYNRAPPPNIVNAAMGDAEAKLGITPVRGVTNDPLLCEYISLTAWPCYDGTIQFLPKLSNMWTRLFYSSKPPCYHTGHDVSATITALRPSFTGLRFMDRFFAWHKARWPKSKRVYNGPNYLRDADALGKLPREVPSVNWNYGFVHKFRIPLTCLDFELPSGDDAHILRHPAITHIFALEHTDPDTRL